MFMNIYSYICLFLYVQYSEDLQQYYIDFAAQNKTNISFYSYKVKEDDPEYLTAIRLIKLLDLVLPLPSDDVPSLSILREFIGRSYFE